MLAPAVRSDGRGLDGRVKQAHEGGGRNCGFDTYEQCMAAVSGAGGYCERNLFFQGDPDVPVRPAHRPRRRG